VEDVGFGGKRKVSAIKVEEPANLSSRSGGARRGTSQLQARSGSFVKTWIARARSLSVLRRIGMTMQDDVASFFRFLR
jgi:hypothetical protein